jgi:hypothetical protein
MANLATARSGGVRRRGWKKENKKKDGPQNEYCLHRYSLPIVPSTGTMLFAVNERLTLSTRLAAIKPQIVCTFKKICQSNVNPIWR